jgi:nucleotide-binding universal stress UspA family protein
LTSTLDARQREQPLNKVVVGVDGSEHSLRALRWAAHQALTMNVPLEVVTAWTFPEEPAPLGIEIHLPLQEDLVDAARAKLTQIIAEFVPEVEQDHVVAKVVPGHPSKVLLDEAGENDLLVVGCRGRSTFEELIFGSTSDHCARHAACPVVVVR